MKVALSGVQCSGKTTLLAAIKDYYGNLFNYDSEVVRGLVKKYGIGVHDKSNELTQLIINQTHVNNARKSGNWIFDRCILDSHCYAEYALSQGQISEGVFELSKSTFESFVNDLDLICYLDPNIPLVDDGFRSTDETFRNEMIRIFEKNISNLPNVTILSGNVHDRLETYTEVVKKIYVYKYF